MNPRCICCDDTGWVCENHQDQSWTGSHALHMRRHQRTVPGLQQAG
jgi:hypothetical protein